MPQIELKGRVSLDGSGFDRTLTNMQGRARAFARNVSGMLAGFFSAAYLTAAARKTAEYGSKIHELAQAHKVSSTRLQEYDHAAQQNGTTVEKLLDVQRKLTKARADALANPNGDAAGAFGKFGFDSARLSGLSAADDLMREFSASLKGVNLDLNSIPLVLALIGERNSEAIPTLVAGLKEAGEDAHRLGLIMEAGIAAQLDEITDKAAVLKKQLTIGLGPTLIRIADTFSEIISGARIGIAVIGAFIEKASSFNIDTPIKDIIAESAKAARAAGVTETVKVVAEQVALEEARKRKANLPALTVDDLIEAQGGKPQRDAPVRENQPDATSAALALNEFQRIGAFAGRGDSASRHLRVSEQQLRELRQIKSNTNPAQRTDIF